jgi:hypothetical protein
MPSIEAGILSTNSNQGQARRAFCRHATQFDASTLLVHVVMAALFLGWGTSFTRWSASGAETNPPVCTKA